MRRVQPLLLGPVMLLVGTLLVLVAPTHAQADDAPRVGIFAQQDGATVKLVAERAGWGVTFDPSYVLGPESGCMYYEMKIAVASGPDPDKKVGPYCVNTEDQFDSHALGVLNRTRTVRAGAGEWITGVELKVCRVRFGIDPCDVTKTSLPQHTSHATASRLDDTIEISNLPLSRFMSLRNDEPWPYDWSNDGCSAPNISGANIWNNRFRKPCLRHDFGYRNFGAGNKRVQWFDPTDTRRKAVDVRFFYDMAGICAVNPQWRSCVATAGLYYKGVRMCGGSSFFHESYESCKRDRRTRDLEDTESPVIDSAGVTPDDKDSGYATYTLAASDDNVVAERRVAVNGTWREWTPYTDSGRFMLPEAPGDYEITFEVKDLAGNVSEQVVAGTVTRKATVGLTLRHVDNNGNVRSCGSTEATACTDVVRKLRTVIDSATSPQADLLLKAWRRIDGSWVETDSSPFMREAIAGRSSITLEVPAGLKRGLWRFKSQVPTTGTTGFGTSTFQYLRMSPPDTTAPTISNATVSHGNPASQFVAYTLDAADDVAVTRMRVLINGVARDWVDHVPSGTVVLPDGYGNFGIGFQVMDAAGNTSAVKFAGTVTRKAEVGLTLDQVDNNGNVRSCGSTEAAPCSDVVKKFRTTISSPVSPDADLLLKAWRKINGSWVETDTSPFMRSTINGRSSITLEVTAGLLEGLWRFQTQVPTTDATQFAASEYQYLAISPPDTTAPTISNATVSHGNPASQFVAYTLDAADDVAVTRMRVLINGVARDWVDHVPSGTVVLPDGYGNFGIGFQVMDAAGNTSAVKFAGTVTRKAEVGLTLDQVDNNGNVRSCGSTEAAPCSDVVKKFRTTISSPVSPQADLLLKAWRKINGSWVETDTSPFMRSTINGRSSITLEVTAGLLEGLWRFQTQVPTTDATQFAASEYQYLTISPPPDTSAPSITGSSLGHGDPASQYVAYALGASDNVGVTHMRVLVNGVARDWVGYAPNGTVVLPDGYGNFGIGFQVMDAAGNASGVHFAGTVTRQAAVGLSLNQVDNNGNVRSCGSTEAGPCSDVVKRFRTVISSPVSPQADLLLKAWRKINGSWVETTTSPFMRETINGRTVITMDITANLALGVWRFQSQVPTTGTTQFAASDYQYLRID